MVLIRGDYMLLVSPLGSASAAWEVVTALLVAVYVWVAICTTHKRVRQTRVGEMTVGYTTAAHMVKMERDEERGGCYRLTIVYMIVCRYMVLRVCGLYEWSAAYSGSRMLVCGCNKDSYAPSLVI